MENGNQSGHPIGKGIQYEYHLLATKMGGKPKPYYLARFRTFGAAAWGKFEDREGRPYRTIHYMDRPTKWKTLNLAFKPVHHFKDGTATESLKSYL